MKIILPSDFSDNAWKAMSYAADLYHNIPCKFYIVNTYHYPNSFPDKGGAMPIEPLKNGSEEQLEILLKQFKDLDHHPQTEFETKSICGPFVNAIQMFEDLFVEPVLIVLGTKGITGIEGQIFGTLTASLIDHVKSTVICVPNAAKLSAPKNSMLCVDEDGIANKEEMQQLFDLVENWKSTLAVVHIGSNRKLFAKESQDRIVINHHLTEIKHSFHTISGNDVEDEITLFAQKNKIDLIAMIKRDNGFFKNLFHTSLTKKYGILFRNTLAYSS